MILEGLIPEGCFYGVAGAMLDFVENLAYILAHYSYAHKNHTTEKPD